MRCIISKELRVARISLTVALRNVTHTHTQLAYKIKINIAMETRVPVKFWKKLHLEQRCKEDKKKEPRKGVQLRARCYYLGDRVNLHSRWQIHACVRAQSAHKYSYRISAVISTAIKTFRCKSSRGMKTSFESLSHTSRNHRVTVINKNSRIGRKFFY